MTYTLIVTRHQEQLLSSNPEFVLDYVIYNAEGWLFGEEDPELEFSCKEERDWAKAYLEGQ